MWADAETDIDFLNYSEVAELVTELITDADLLPLSLGVFGGWGSGKSSTLRLVEAELLKQPQPPLIVKFDAWLYQDFDDARAALMSVIAKALFEASPPTLKDKAASLIRRVNKLRFLGLAVEAGALAMGVPTFGVAARGIEGVGDALRSKADDDDVTAMKAAAKDVKDRGTGLLRPAEERSPPEEIDAFRTEFGELLKTLNRPLVVFIDNLDRCLPANAIHTLEAVRLFLFIPRTAFVIAADEDMIRHAVLQHFKNPAERHVSDYLDKLIQVPVRVPRVGVQEVRAYLFMLLCSRAGLNADDVERLRNALIEKLRLSWRENDEFTVDAALKILRREQDEQLRQSLEMADRMASLLARSGRVLGNPRIVKRMLNVVRMRASVAKRRRMPLDEAIIAKLALFERCTDEEATEALHLAINLSADGRPEALQVLEASNAKPPPDGSIPAPWAKHLGFLQEWSLLDPRLAGVDLRPAVYLARETVPLQISRSASSPVVIQAVETLMKVTSISSQAGKAVLDALGPDDGVMVMEALISEMRKDSNWARTRPDFRGALMMAQRSPAAAQLLARFIRSLQLERQPAWMSTMLKGEIWWEGK